MVLEIASEDVVLVLAVDLAVQVVLVEAARVVLVEEINLERIKKTLILDL